MGIKITYRHILKVLRDFLILILIGNLIAIFTIPRDLWSLEVVLRNCMFSIGIGYPAWRGMSYIIVVLERKIPWLKYPIKRLVVQVLAMTLFAGILIFIGFSIWIWLVKDLSFRSIIEFIIPTLKIVYIFMILSLVIGNSIDFFKNWRDAAIQQEELKRAHLALQYQTLKDQVRPHFLFNSLSSLVTLINTDSEKATRFVHKLSDVYRYVLEQRENELVPVTEEVKFLEDFIYLQKIRYGENLQVHFKLKLDHKRMVIPLSMQMMVENAIKHNEISGEHPLVIDIYSTNQDQVVIRNNLQKKEVTEKSPGMGIENLRKRISFFTVEPLLIEEEPETFTATIPTIPT
ncbi:MAG: sensor histidine kinase [Bacteroidales bacterium]|nr:sensor histidine kinase [Bacteroidales bacterium]